MTELSLQRIRDRLIDRCVRWPGVLGLLAGMTGCFQPDPPTIEQCKRGSVVMLPGIEGSAWQFGGTYHGLREAGCDQRIEVIEWGYRPFGSLTNLMDLERNKQRAATIAAHVADLQREHPDRPVTLVGFSGGGGLAVLVTEALPEDVRLERLIIIGAALSNDYDLSKAMTHCRHGIVNYYSPVDDLILGFGTRTFGNIDRGHGDSAGRKGFRAADGSLPARPDLEQIAWTPKWRRLGHDGHHLGWLSQRWAHDVLAARIGVSPAPTLNAVHTTTQAAAPIAEEPLDVRMIVGGHVVQKQTTTRPAATNAVDAHS